MSNIILMTDSYKVSHWKQYPPGTEKVYSYFESRGGAWPYTVFFGLSIFIKKYLIQPITREDIDEAQNYFDQHLGPGMFNREGWEIILKEHQGYLPVIIKAVPEGSIIPGRNVLMTIENKDPRLFWLTNYLETLLVQVWYPTTVATLSRECKKIIHGFLLETGDPSLIDFKLHDFGFRGSTSPESAGIGGVAHLVNFMGTDTVAALEIARKYYGEPMAGFSIPAAEHSTITSWGKENEYEAFRNMLEQWPTGLVAVVSDSYDIIKACREGWGKELKELVLSREGTLVVRPDSGDPAETVLEVLNTLGDAFGTTLNDKGYRVLPDQLRVIQGDGINIDSLRGILAFIKANQWSADNIAFGMGGGLLQQVDRDTLRFAFKCSSITVDGKQRDVFKDPITDQGKKSKPGRLKLVRLEGAHGGSYMTVDERADGNDFLQTVFDEGCIHNESFSVVRERAKL